MSAALLHGTALAQVAVPDFRLPPSAPTNSPEPQRQGPVAPDLPQSRPTPTPAPAPTSQPAVQPPPLVVPPAATPTPTTTRSARPVPSAAPTPDRPAAAEAEPAPAAETTPAPATPAPDPIEAPQAPPPAPVPATQEADEGGMTVLGWLALAGLLAGGALLLLLRRRRATVDEPELEPQPTARVLPDPPAAPVAAPRPVPAPAPIPPPTPAFQVDIGLAGVELHVTAGRLSLSLMNAALTFQLTLRHSGPAQLTGLVLRADLIGAHAALQQEEQLGGPAPEAPVIARLPALVSGEPQTIAGEVRLPLAQVAAIRQGRSSLFVPLLRLALEGEGGDRRTLTMLVGPPGQGGQVQPVRLDGGPRVVAPLQARVLG